VLSELSISPRPIGCPNRLASSSVTAGRLLAANKQVSVHQFDPKGHSTVWIRFWVSLHFPDGGGQLHTAAETKSPKPARSPRALGRLKTSCKTCVLAYEHICSTVFIIFTGTQIALKLRSCVYPIHPCNSMSLYIYIYMYIFASL